MVLNIKLQNLLQGTNDGDSAIIYFSAKLCSVIPYLPHSTVVVNEPYLEYTCDPGYRFDDGVQVKILACSEADCVVGRTPFVCLGD